VRPGPEPPGPPAGFRAVTVSLQHRSAKEVADSLNKVLSKTTSVVTPLGDAGTLLVADLSERVEAALELVDLSDRMRHLPRQLSGGQEQRVAIARALVTDPTLLVADEPTGNLDAHSAAEVLALLQTLNRSAGKTVIVVTHDPKAAAYARRTVHLEKGELLNGQHP